MRAVVGVLIEALGILFGAFSSATSRIAFDDDLKKTILEIEFRGKRGVGYCKSMPGAVLPFK